MPCWWAIPKTRLSTRYMTLSFKYIGKNGTLSKKHSTSYKLYCVYHPKFVDQVCYYDVLPTVGSRRLYQSWMICSVTLIKLCYKQNTIHYWLISNASHINKMQNTVEWSVVPVIWTKSVHARNTRRKDRLRRANLKSIASQKLQMPLSQNGHRYWKAEHCSRQKGKEK